MKPPKKCPICHSKQWRKINDRYDGYSFWKAFLANLFLGRHFGTLAGFIGKRKQMYFCYNCSFQLEYEL